jgi:6-pyruvoyltetrahydropterin/6-carboxytetrahydropterin synthase
MLTVSKRISFAAAHHLPNYVGACHNLHGHEWQVELFVRRTDGDVDPTSGMVLDFKLLKEQLSIYIEEIFDHRLINDVLQNPTAELMVKYMVKRLAPVIESLDCDLVGLKVWETPDSCCEWSRDENLLSL